MVQIKERTVVRPGGIIQIQRADLPEGAAAEVTVMIEQPILEPPLPPLASFRGAAKGVYGTPEEVDAYLERERASWD